MNLQQERILNRLMRLMDGTRIPVRAVRQLVRTHGMDAEDAVRKNPFIMTRIDNVGFGAADKLADKLKLGPRFPPRIACGITSVLATAASQWGHVCYPRERLIEDAVRILGKEVRSNVVDARIEDLHKDEEIYYGADEMVYLWKFFREELFLSERLAALLRNPVVPIEPSLSGLAEDQIAAVEAIRRHAVAILTGPPGTGKSFLVRRLISSLPAKEVALCAPTGKAAKRIMELTDRPAHTIHRLLEAQVDDKGGFMFARGHECPLEERLIIIDEMSMVQQSLMYSLLKAVENGTRLILIGDVDQLPPVGAGNVLRDMISSETIPVAELTTIKRQDPGFIIQACHAIRKGETPPREAPWTRDPEDLPLEGGDLWYVLRETQTQILETIRDLMDGTLKGMGYDPLRDCQVLSPYRQKTDLSCDAINSMLQERYTLPEPGVRLKFRVGDKVINTRNDYTLDIMNGDIGFIDRIDVDPATRRSTYVVKFENPERIVDLEARDHNLMLAYCITVHKMQGSEQDVIILPIHEAYGNWFVQRNWLYTAISRAKKQCIIVGNLREIPKIVKRNHQEQRYTQLAERLQEEIR